MTGILKIDLPDDFKKGDKSCEYCYTYAGMSIRLCDLTHGKDCNADNCPLEILETGEEISCRQCYFYNSDGERCLECDDIYSLFMYPPDNRREIQDIPEDTPEWWYRRITNDNR